MANEACPLRLAELPAGGGVVAVSGGADSVALVRGLAAVSEGPLIVAHLNHRLRGDDSDADEAFVRALAADLRLEFRGERIDVRAEAAGDKEYRPLGARKTAKADVRIIAASNASMDELLNSGRIRQDLFYRLNVLPLHLPPLRQRKEDIPLLARHFVVKYAAETDGKARDIALASLQKLSLYDWPGNVRELENIIERAVVLSTTDVIHSAEIDLPISAEPDSEPESFSLLKAKVVAEFERSHLQALLEQHRGNIGQAARAAQKNRRVFFQLMRKHNIRVDHSMDASSGKRVVKIVIAVDKNVHPPVCL